MGFWPVVLNVLRNSDVVLLVLDARMPGIAANSEIVGKVEKMGKDLVYVFNKCDLIGNDDLAKLKRDYPNAFFISALIAYLRENAKGLSAVRKRKI